MSVAFDTFWWWLREFGELSESYRTLQQVGGHHKSSPSTAHGSVQDISSNIFYGDDGTCMDFMSLDPSFSLPGYPGWDWAATMVLADPSQITTESVPTFSKAHR
jgi:hypothetical protein